MKVYLVNREDEDSSILMKIFSTREKAQAYVNKLNEKHKHSMAFRYKYFGFDIEEKEVE